LKHVLLVHLPVVGEGRDTQKTQHGIETHRGPCRQEGP